MVLKNSKYDKQAKWNYMKKHGLLPKKAAKAEKPKWSAKKKPSNDQEFIKLDIDEMTSDWDSDIDEDIVNHFYPQLTEELPEIPIEHKRRIKRQIIEDLKVQRNELFNKDETDIQEEEDGIYLGEKPDKPKVQLSEFLPEIPIMKRRNRKLPINEVSDDLLAEYGIEDYSKTIKEDNDYDIIRKKKLNNRRIEDLPIDQLVGFEVGKDSLADIGNDPKPKNNIKYLTEEELKQEEERNAKRKQADFYLKMKNKFLDKPKDNNKVLHLNNYDTNNQDHMDYINKKLASSSQTQKIDIDDDIEELLGSKMSRLEVKQETPLNDVDGFLDSLPNRSDIKQDKQKPPKAVNKSIEELFLDDLLS